MLLKAAVITLLIVATTSRIGNTSIADTNLKLVIS